MTKTEIIKNHCKQLNLSALSNQLDRIIIEAENEKISYFKCTDSKFRFKK
jgi:hypothetical protein